MTDEPVFIVGAPRSGTTLLAALLSSHRRLTCGPETQLFSKLGRHGLAQALSDPHWPQLATEMVGSVTLAGQRVIDLFQVSQEQVFAFMKSRPPGAKAMLEALTVPQAARSGKPRWIEKTPDHLLYLDVIRRNYPHSPIVRIVRDPRDASLSMCKLPWASKSVLANGMMWMEWFEASRGFFESDRKCLTVWYERLVGDPNAELRRICDFIGETFDPQMLDTRDAGKHVTSPNETWKAAVAKPLNQERAFAWRSELDPGIAHATTLMCYLGIEALGYEADVWPVRTLPAYPFSRKAIEVNEGALVRAAQHRTRVTRCPNPMSTGELLIMAWPRTVPMARRWLKQSTLALARRLAGKRTLYLIAENHGSGPAAWPLRLFAKRVFDADVRA